MNRQLFFDRIRQSVFGGRLSQEQVRGVNAILSALEGWPTRWVAYGLATAFHETAATMLPIKERGGNAYFTRMYDVTGERPELAKRMGNRLPGDGPKYCGRGYVQLTWRTNYAKAANVAGADLVNQPDLAMQPEIAALIMRNGMEEGWFTGNKLGDYLNGSKTDYHNARRVINKTDKAAVIAGYAASFESALRAAGYGQALQSPKQTPEPQPAATPAPNAPSPPSAQPENEREPVKPWWQSNTYWAWFASALSGLGLSADKLLSIDWKPLAVLCTAGLIAATAWGVYRHVTRRKKGFN